MKNKWESDWNMLRTWLIEKKTRWIEMMEVVVVVEMKDEKEIIIHIFKVMKLYIIYIFI